MTGEALPGPGPGCDYCRDGTVLRWVSGSRFAALHACELCGDGRKIADTIMPAVTGGDDPAG